MGLLSFFEFVDEEVKKRIVDDRHEVIMIEHMLILHLSRDLGEHRLGDDKESTLRILFDCARQFRGNARRKSSRRIARALLTAQWNMANGPWRIRGNE